MQDLIFHDWQVPLTTILAGIFCSLPCAWLGCFLLLRRMSLLGDAVSHAVLPGIVVAAIWSGSLSGWPVMVGAILMGLLTAFLTQTLNSYGQVSEDSGMGIVFTSLFATGVIILSRYAEHAHIDTDCALYGVIELIPLDTVRFGTWEIPRAFLTQVPVLIAVALFLALFWKEWLLSSFDPALSTAMGFSASLLHYGLMGLVAVVCVASFESVGSVLVIAMMIVPPATAHLLTDRLLRLLILSSVVCIVASVSGYWTATYWNTSVAGMISVSAGAQFLLALLLAPRYGLLARTWHSLSLTLRITAEDLIGVLYRAEELGLARGISRGLSVGECLRLTSGGWLAWCLLPLLRHRNLIVTGPQQELRLTEKGRTRARSLVRSHRLWEAFLEKHFALPQDHLHAAAARLEHYIGPELQDRLQEELKTPGLDPHGRQIP